MSKPFINEDKCLVIVNAKVSPRQATNYVLAANAAANGNRSAWIKRTLDRAAKRVLRGQR